MSKIFRITADSREHLDKLLRDSLFKKPQKKPDYQNKNYNASFLYTDGDDYQKKIQSLLIDNSRAYNPQPQHKICFLYTGQGCQYPGMARELYETSACIRDSLDHYANVLDANNQFKYLPCLIGDIDDIHQTKYTQPSIVMLQLALNNLWQNLGVKPDFLIGHSVGEFSASVAHGNYTEESILKLIAKRADLMQNVKVSGGMIAIKGSHSTIKSILAEEMIDLDFAALNEKNQTVLSGSKDEIEKIKEQCALRNIKSRILTVSHPFHSNLMQPVIKQFREYCHKIQTQQSNSSTILFSNLNGQALQHPQDADYWCNHILKPVMFMQSIESAWQQGARIFIEVGPDAILGGLTKKILAGQKEAVIIQTMKKGKSAHETLKEASVKLEQLGYLINWESLSRMFEIKSA